MLPPLVSFKFIRRQRRQCVKRQYINLKFNRRRWLLHLETIIIMIISLGMMLMLPPQSLKSRSDFCAYLFQDKDSIPKEITDTIHSVHIEKDEHVLDPILGSDSYTNVINRIEVMDDALGEFNNGDLDTDWYDVVDISAVRLQTEFINEGFSNSDTDVHIEEDFDHNSIVDPNEDTIDFEPTTMQININTVAEQVHMLSFFTHHHYAIPFLSSFLDTASGRVPVYTVVSSFKPLQGSGGGIRRILIFIVRTNNEKRFVSELFQEKLQPLQSSFVPGDTPLKLIDSQHSKKVEVQKHYEKGRFLRAIMHLLEIKELLSDDDSAAITANPITSNNSTIDMSNIDFNIPSKKLKVVILLQTLKSRSDFCDYLFQDKDSIPKEITDTIQSVHIEKNEHVLDPILGSDSYTNVIICIEVIDNNHGEDNNNDLALDWYDVVDVYTVRFQIDLRFNYQETSFLHSSSTTAIKFRFPFLTIDKGTSSNSNVDSNDLPSINPNLVLSVYTSSNPGNAFGIVLHPTMVLASPTLSIPVPGSSRCIHLVPVLYSCLTFGVQVAKIVVQFIDNNFTVDIKGKDYQHFRFLFELTTIHRKQRNIYLHSHVFSFKPISGSASGIRQDIKLLRIKFVQLGGFILFLIFCHTLDLEY